MAELDLYKQSSGIHNDLAYIRLFEIMLAETKDKVIHKRADISDKATHLLRIMAETIISMSVICYRETFDKMEQDIGESPNAYFARLKSKATACK